MNLDIDYGDVRAVAAETKKLVRRWKAAYSDMRRASQVRANLGPHASRARLTSASARYARAAEEFDRLDAQLVAWSQTVDPVPLDIDALRAELTSAQPSNSL